MPIVRFSSRWVSLFFCLSLPFFFLQGYQSPAYRPNDRPASLLLNDEAKEWIRMAQQLVDSVQYDSALTYYNKAQAFYESFLDNSADTASLETYLQIENAIAQIFLKQGKYQQGLDLLEEAFAKSTSNLIEENLQVGNNFEYQGEAKSNLGRFEEAIYSFQLANSIFEKLRDIPLESIADNYLDIGYAYYRLFRYDKVLVNAQQAYEIINKLPLANKLESKYYLESKYNNLLGNLAMGQNNYAEAINKFKRALQLLRFIPQDKYLSKISTSNYNLCILYNKMYLSDSALVCCQEALKVDKELYGDSHPYIADDLDKIGVIYRIQSNFQEATEYFLRALSIRKELYKNKADTRLADSYINLGLVNWNLGNFEEAKKYHEKALKINENASGNNDRQLGVIFANIGVVYADQKNYRQAIDYYQRAIKIDQKYDNRLGAAMTLNDIGDAFEHLDEFEKALQFFQQSSELFNEMFGKKNPHTGNVFNNIGECYLHKHRYEEAIVYFQKAVNALVLDYSEDDINFLPDLSKRTNNPVFLVQSLMGKGLCFEGLYKTTSQLQYLSSAVNHYHQAAKLIDTIVVSYSRDESRAELMKNVRSIYEGAIRSAQQLYEITGSDSLAHLVFNFFEKSKSTILRNAVLKSRTIKYLGIPNQLLGYEVEINSELAFYEKSIFEELSKKELTDSAKLNLWQNKVFFLHRAKDSLVQ